MEEKSRIVELLTPHVQKLFGEDSSGHDMGHLQRTRKAALYLQSKEGGDREVIEAAAFLHDVHRIMQNNLGHFVDPADSIDTVKELLSHVDLTDRQKEKICFSIKFHELYNWNGNNVDDLETLILQDADNLDAVGAIGLVRTVAFGIANNRPFYDDGYPLEFNEDYTENQMDPSSLHHIHHKLLRLAENMNTKTARELAAGRSKFLRSFSDQFLSEWKGEF